MSKTATVKTGPLTGKITTRDGFTIVTTAKARYTGTADEPTFAKGLVPGMTIAHPYDGTELLVAETIAEPKSTKVHAYAADALTKAGKPRKNAKAVSLWFTNGVVVDVTNAPEAEVEEVEEVEADAPEVEAEVEVEEVGQDDDATEEVAA